jgi:hypothetical protein
MNRRVALLTVLLLTSMVFAVNADTYFGAKKALNLSAHSGTSPPFPQKRRPLGGLDAGVWFGWPLGERWMLQTEVLIATRGERIKDGDTTFRDIYTYIDFPFLAKWEVGRWSLVKLLFPGWEGIYRAWLYGGLRSSTALSGLGSVETDTWSSSWFLPRNDAFPGGDVGLVWGFEWRWTLLHHMILADLRYAAGFIEVSEPNHRHRVLSLFLGYGFNMSADRKKRR